MSMSSSEEEAAAVGTLMEVQSIQSSEDPPMEEWSSLVLFERKPNLKKEAFAKGLYEPESSEICAKYIALSDSSVLRHPYYCYPAVEDPGIVDALLEPAVKIEYPDDGQEIYLAACKEMDQCRVRIFYKGLLTDEIDLSYYCVDPQGVRAMAIALNNNTTVKTLNMTENYLSQDACFHLGEMLTLNEALYELNLTGCHIGPEGLRQLLHGLQFNRTLMVLNLTRNAITDVGGIHLADAIGKVLYIKQINLKCNDLGSTTATALAEVFEYFNTLSHIDLSWNKFFSPVGTVNMLSLLQDNEFLKELNLSWNALTGPKLAAAIKRAMLAPQLTVLDLSNNNFLGEDVVILSENLTKAKNLHTFNLSCNPLSVEDANVLIGTMRRVACKLKNLHLDNIDVDSNFVATVERIKRIKSKKDVVITFGQIKVKKAVPGPDPRELLMNRLEYVTTAKKTKVDVVPIILRLVKNGRDVMDMKELHDELKREGATMIDTNLLEAIADTFKGPKSKTKLVNLWLLADYMKRKWPDRTLPPTPPPPPPPPPVVDKKQGKGKDRTKPKKK
ncbi:NLR family CARD domain-containing protein 3-like [Phthorimaea operculella]|nr:NLR family CARD domain-containing protein 3-like [Phthorimaea operculella]